MKSKLNEYGAPLSILGNGEGRRLEKGKEKKNPFNRMPLSPPKDWKAKEVLPNHSYCMLPKPR